MLHAIAVSILLASSSSDDVARRFIGTWTPDLQTHQRYKELKELRQGAAIAPPALPSGILYLPKVRISLTEGALLFESLDENGALSSAMRVTTDGRENVNPHGGQGRSHVSTSAWKDGVLKITWKLMVDGAATMTGVDTWSLSPDGATLTQTSEMEDSRSRSRTRTSYRRGDRATTPVR